MATPNDPQQPGPGTRSTSKAAGRTVRRSAKTGRFVGASRRSTKQRPSRAPASAPDGTLEAGGFGCAKGLIWIAPDFDEPLEEFDADS